MKRMRKPARVLAQWGMFVVLAVVCGAAQAQQSTAVNTLPNGSFEEQSDGKPAQWTTATWGGAGEFVHAEVGRTGNRSVMISSKDGADISWTATVSVEPRSTYRLSGWIKTQDVTPVEARRGRGALINIHNMQPLATNAIRGTADWTQVELVFETDANDAVQINCLFGGWGLVTGTAWFDDLRLERLSTEEWNPSIAIDASKPGHPVSKYIYGQFIEHLGRCIYGGIWAEMLEDRKFYYPVTADYAPYGDRRPRGERFPVVRSSPWKIIGPADSVQMETREPFVGEHTPRVAPGAGIRQHDLALVAGKKYQGYLWAKSAGAGPAQLTVTLSSADGTSVAECGAGDYTRHAFEFVATEATDRATLSITVSGQPCLIGTVSLMPADNIHGMRPDTLALLKELNSPVYRWPGGNFVSGYDWKDGVGDRDRRPPRKNPAWTGVEHNDFGLDEFMVFCRWLDTEPYIAVNSGLGEVESAVEQLQYANGAVDTPMGAWRAKNGHPEPYAVKWWGVGNEMYGGWQLGHMPLEQYIEKHNEFAKALVAEDDSIVIIAVGAVGPWSEGMMQQCAEHMDLISEHFYVQDRPGLASHVAQVPHSIRHIAQAHREYRERFESLAGKNINIALDEWNYWYGPHVFGELGTRYFLKDGLGVAAGIHEYIRQSDIMFMANYAQTVNVIGCIKTSKTESCFETTGLMLKLYREQFGTQPLAVTTQSPLDVAAALTEDGRTLTVGIVNPTMEPLTLPLTIQGLTLSGTGERWQMAGPDPMAYNEPGQPPKVVLEHAPLTQVGAELQVAPCSVTLFKLGVR